jgi:NAD-dependent DNA ligase
LKIPFLIRLKASVLNEKTILKTFGSVKKLRKAKSEQITKQVPNIGAKLAEIIVKNLIITKTIRLALLHLYRVLSFFQILSESLP